MKNISQKILTTLSMVILIFTLVFPVNAFATTGTLGTERPKLTATFIDSDNQEADGDHLEPGNYTVNINLSGVSSVAFFEFTADYTNDITINSVSSIADIDDSQFETAHIKNEDNSLVVMFISENDDCTAVTSGQTMITMDVTVNTAGDFRDFFVVSTNPKTTLIGVDFGDGFDSMYVCKENEVNPVANQYPFITYDMSPNLTSTTYDVTGQIGIATDLEGTENNGGIVDITVSVDGTDIADTTDRNGYYTLSGLEEGTYALTIHGDTTIDRHVTLVVSADKAEDGIITVDIVPVCICDYNPDGIINAGDTAQYGSAIGMTSRDEDFSNNFDLNPDGIINGADTAVYGSFIGNKVIYTDVTL